MKAITNTNFNFPKQKSVYHGKVRDVYNINNQFLAMVATDRISAFDVVLPKGIPFKGQVLNQLAEIFLKATEDIVPNWRVASPDPNVTIGHFCKPLKLKWLLEDISLVMHGELIILVTGYYVVLKCLMG
jgi:phosphoribosylaminoimidazole-succinocarboxamide synthase